MFKSRSSSRFVALGFAILAAATTAFAAVVPSRSPTGSISTGRNAVWYIMGSEDNTFYGGQFGVSSDLPAPGDYDGDGTVDIAVFRPSDGNWYELRSTSGFTVVHFGSPGDRPAQNAFVY